MIMINHHFPDRPRPQKCEEGGRDGAWCFSLILLFWAKPKQEKEEEDMIEAYQTIPEWIFDCLSIYIKYKN